MNTIHALPRSRPELQGLEPATVARFLERIEELKEELHSFMIVRHGHVVAEGWWPPYAPERPHLMFSLSKSFTSTAIGLLAAEGSITLEDRVVSFFPEKAPETISRNLEMMTIRDMLMMGTGHAEDTSGRMTASDDWVYNFLQLPVEYAPGTHFVYNSGATYMLSAIVQQVTGQKLLDYLQPRLLAPLGIEGATTESSPQGIHTGGWGMKLKTEDIAKFGQLYLQKGVWNGARLLSEAWITEATSRQIANDPNPGADWAQGYGYQFWRCQHNAYRGDGAFGQFCIVMPDQDAIVAITSGVSDMQAIMNAVWELLLPAMQAGELAEDHNAAAALAAKLSSLSLQPPPLESASPREAELSGAIYRLEANEEKLERLTVIFSPEEAVLVLSGEGGEQMLRCGRGEWGFGASSLQMPYADASGAAFGWEDADTLIVSLRYIETPFRVKLTCRFADDGLELSVEANGALSWWYQWRAVNPIRGIRA